MTSDELRNLADDGDKIDWYGPGSRFTDALREAADQIDNLNCILDGYASGFDTQNEEIERLTARVAELEATK